MHKTFLRKSNKVFPPFLLLCISLCFLTPRYSSASIEDEFRSEIRTRLLEVGSMLEGVNEQNAGMAFKALQTTFGVLGTTNELINAMVEKAVEIYLESLFRSARIQIEAVEEILEFQMAFRRGATRVILEEVQRQLPGFVEDPIIYEKLDNVTLHLYKSFTEADSKVSQNQKALVGALEEFYRTAYVHAKTGLGATAKAGLMLNDARELHNMYRFASWVTKGIAGQMASTNSSFWVALKRWSPVVVSRTGMTAGKAASAAIGGILFVADITGAGATAVHYHKTEPLLKDAFSTLSILWEVYGQGSIRKPEETDIQSLVYALQSYRDAVEHFEKVTGSDEWYQFIKRAFLWLVFKSEEYKEAARVFKEIKVELDGRIAYWQGITSPIKPQEPSPVQAVLLILDTSASMSEKAKGTGLRKIDVAKDALKEVLEAPKAQGMAWAIMVYDGCNRTPVIAPAGGGFTKVKAKILGPLPSLKPHGQTPLALSILNAGRYIGSHAAGKKAQLVLLTDGHETCKGDPVAAARKVTGPKLSSLERDSSFARLFGPSLAYAQARSSNISINVIGFGIQKGSKEEAQLSEIAKAGKGRYYPARDAGELAKSMGKATGVIPDDGPFKKRVYKEVEYE